MGHRREFGKTLSVIDAQRIDYAENHFRVVKEIGELPR